MQHLQIRDLTCKTASSDEVAGLLILDLSTQLGYHQIVEKRSVKITISFSGLNAGGGLRKSVQLFGKKSINRRRYLLVATLRT